MAGKSVARVTATVVAASAPDLIRHDRATQYSRGPVLNHSSPSKIDSK
jgi:hypothetical protein